MAQRSLLYIVCLLLMQVLAAVAAQPPFRPADRLPAWFLRAEAAHTFVGLYSRDGCHRLERTATGTSSWAMLSSQQASKPCIRPVGFHPVASTAGVREMVFWHSPGVAEGITGELRPLEDWTICLAVVKDYAQVRPVCCRLMCCLGCLGCLGCL
jgi:hypothetical protein